MSNKITSIPEAARLARTIMSDIKIYNEERIRRGLENDRLFEEIEEDLRDGLKMWNEKVSEEIVQTTNLFHKAFVDTIFAGSSNVRTRIC